MSSGTVPSKMEMFRLLMKTEVRESAMKMAAAFQEAGIDLQSKVGSAANEASVRVLLTLGNMQDMMKSLMAMQKQFKGDK